MKFKAELDLFFEADDIKSARQELKRILKDIKLETGIESVSVSLKDTLFNEDINSRSR